MLLLKLLVEALTFPQVIMQLSLTRVISVASSHTWTLSPPCLLLVTLLAASDQSQAAWQPLSSSWHWHGSSQADQQLVQTSDPPVHSSLSVERHWARHLATSTRVLVTELVMRVMMRVFMMRAMVRLMTGHWTQGP